MAGNSFVRFLCSLRTLRRYRDEPVPEVALRAILEAGRWCGSAVNRQPWQFVVVRDPATRAQLADLSPYAEFVADAPVCIAVVMDGEGTGLSFDAGRVAQNLLLAAHAQGIGSCNAGLPAAEQQRAARELLGVPDGHSLGVLVALGYPAPGDPLESPAGPRRRALAPMLGRKPLSALVHHERFGRRTPGQSTPMHDRGGER